MLTARACLLAVALCIATPVFAQTADPPAPAATSDLENRIEQLEGQIVDMQVVTGTLQSLTKGGGAAAGSLRSTTGEGGEIDQRVRGMESRMQALAAQVQQLARQIQALDARVGGSGGLQLNSSQGTAAVAPEPAPDLGGFGETTIDQQGTSEPIGSSDNGASANGQAVDPIGDQIASLGEAGDPNQAYEEAYGYWLQQDYASAEVAFTEFLGRHADSKLAGNAQYWLGESFYVRGQYKQAADSFLKGYRNHKKSQQAPDSLLKLAMSLSRLGEKDAACSGFSRLDTEFPNASAQVKSRAASERQRAGC